MTPQPIEPTMHHFISFVLILGFCFLLIVGLLSVLQDLMDRDFHAPPRMNASARLKEGDSVAASTPEIEQQPSLHIGSGQRS